MRDIVQDEKHLSGKPRIAGTRMPVVRFYSLYDKVYRWDILLEAWRIVKANKGGPGVDGLTIAQIERKGGSQFLKGIQRALIDNIYKPQKVREKLIPKPDGSPRQLGIPVIKDRVVQMAVKLVIEPIFEADFQECSYGFRPRMTKVIKELS